MEFISEEIFEKYSKMKILVFEIFEKGQILRPFLGLAPSKAKKKRGPERVKKLEGKYLFVYKLYCSAHAEIKNHK